MKTDLDRLVHTETYQVKGYDVMHDLSMKPAELVRAMHDSAIAQVVDLKLSATELQPLGLGWALVHQMLEVFTYPRMGDTITITTHPSGKHRVYTYRDYKVHHDGRLLAQASTAWVLLDIRNHRLAPYPTDIDAILAESNQLPALPRPSLSEPRLLNDPLEKTFEVQYSDIDFNGHVSNQCFFKWMLDAMPHEFLRDNRPVAFNTRFKGEAFLAQPILVQHYEQEPHLYFHSISSEGTKLVQGYTRWVKK